MKVIERVGRKRESKKERVVLRKHVSAINNDVAKYLIQVNSIQIPHSTFAFPKLPEQYHTATRNDASFSTQNARTVRT